jgi:hypothetical protein
MATQPLLNAGLQGVRDGLLRANDAATRIAGSGASGDLESITEAAIDLRAAELQVKASARVVDAAGQTLGTIIDVLA